MSNLIAQLPEDVQLYLSSSRKVLFKKCQGHDIRPGPFHC